MDALTHRGPHGGATYCRDQVALGHRRLAVIDIENGVQPITSADGQLVLTFNGEIYNHKEVRATLEAMGCIFLTNSDSEVLLQAWNKWGTGTLSRLRGMFAFALIDWNARVLFLARDPLGIKPLNYLLAPDRIVFSSELHAIARLADFKSDISVVALDEYLTGGYILAPNTIYQNVKKVIPGHLLTVNIDTGRMGEGRYWRPRFQRSLTNCEHELDDLIHDQLMCSVRSHLESDVPCGVYLSGGIDSTLIASMMSLLAVAPILGFTVGFNEREFDERAYAMAAAQRLNIEHHILVSDSRILDGVPRLMRHYGEPFADPSAPVTAALAEFAAKSRYVILSGDGADEIFSGYLSHERWVNYCRSAAKGAVDSDAWAHRMTGALFSKEQRGMLWRSKFHPSLEASGARLSEIFAEAPDDDPLSQARYMDLLTYLPGWILTKQDIASMMSGVEVRTPFADVEFVSFASQIPSELILKMDAGQVIGKYPLKRLLASNFPSTFINRRKQGFVPPIQNWMATDVALLKGIHRSLVAPGTLIAEYFNLHEVDNLFRLPSRQGWSGIWALYCLEQWLRGSHFS